jgi:hypothetical protein
MSGDLEFAKQPLRDLDLKDTSLTVEGLFTKLEENLRLLECLEAESPAKTPGPRVKQELQINRIKRKPSHLWQIQRFNNNPNAHRVE